ncbi:hypothetical protein [Lysobacter panacisoli]|nr:hypothetical protein [Lysobacter panacisoli]
MRSMPLLLAILALPALAATPKSEPKPEIARGAVPPQAPNAVHTLRQIPEACARMEGMFTGQAADPYAFTVVRTSPQCQPRARFVDAAKVKPSTSGGWLLNDVIRVPNAACPSQQAVVRVWRKPVATTAPQLDAQGKARIYLQDSKQQAQSGQIAPVTMFAAQMAVEGRCD